MAGSTFPIAVPILAIDRFSGPLGKFGGELGKIGNKARAVGKHLTVGLTLPLVALAAGAAKTGVTFQRSLNEVQASTFASADEMAGLREQIDGLAGQTHTLTEVAGAAALLAGEGESLASIQAELAGVLQLATVGAFDQATAVELLTGTLDAFNLSAETSTRRVTDVLAAAGQTTNLENLVAALKIAGPRAQATGQQLEPIVAILDHLADAGFDATQGGTAIQQTLEALIRPGGRARAEFEKLRITARDLRDADGNLLPLLDVIDLLAEKGATSANVLRIFGSTGGPAMAALLERGTGAVRESAAALEDVDGRAEELIGILTSGGVDSTTKFATAWERVAQAIAESGVLEAIASGAELVSGWAKAFQALDPSTKKIVVGLGAVVAVVGPLLILFGSLVSAIGAIATAATVVGPVIAAALPFLGIAAAIAAVIAAGVALVVYWDEIKAAAVQVWGAVKSAVGGALDWVAEKIASIVSLAPDWLIELFGGTPSVGAPARLSTPALEGTPVGGRLDAARAQAQTASQTQVGGRVQVDFRNVPPGTRIQAEPQGDVGLDVHAGYNLAGAL